MLLAAKACALALCGEHDAARSRNRAEKNGEQGYNGDTVNELLPNVFKGMHDVFTSKGWLVTALCSALGQRPL